MTITLDTARQAEANAPLPRLPRVAIFQAGWPLQVHTLNLAKALIDEGHPVDLYLYLVDTSFVDLSSAEQMGLSVHAWLSPPPTTEEVEAQRPSDPVKSSLRKVGPLRRARGAVTHFREWLLMVRRSRQELIPDEAMAAAIASVRAHPHAALVGVEKLGLVWASEVSEATGVPYAYYSLELYTTGHEFVQSLRDRRVKALESIAHQGAAATIIQDEPRARLLLSDNKVASSRLIFLPVSLPGPASTQRTRYFQERLGLAPAEKVVLQLGEIRPGRLSGEIAQAAQSLPPGCRLVMHGYGNPDAIEAVRQLDTGSRIAFSLDLVGADELPELVAGADVGLVLYQSTTENERLTGKSSEKLALFLRSGVPVVTFDYPGYEHIREYGCGVLIRDLAEMPDAVATILEDREGFSANALRCFEDHYDFNLYGPRAAKEIAALGSR